MAEARLGHPVRFPRSGPAVVAEHDPVGRGPRCVGVFGENGERVRVEVDHVLSQRQLAELVGTTQSAIARLEGGRISPSLPTLDRIANALGAEVTVTFTDTEALLGTR